MYKYVYICVYMCIFKSIFKDRNYSLNICYFICHLLFEGRHIGLNSLDSKPTLMQQLETNFL